MRFGLPKTINIPLGISMVGVGGPQIYQNCTFDRNTALETKYIEFTGWQSFCNFCAEGKLATHWLHTYLQLGTDPRRRKKNEFTFPSRTCFSAQENTNFALITVSVIIPNAKSFVFALSSKP